MKHQSGSLFERKSGQTSLESQGLREIEGASPLSDEEKTWRDKWSKNQVFDEKPNFWDQRFIKHETERDVGVKKQMRRLSLQEIRR